ncbi:hypothetical protein IQ06DRAFT_11662 [Phaeosphaeriaceae sp. SRC1lsM3a]|nr:hypothetical protein IQ06DRAFT_11662 [Stagonospora sp. SRC1lsM3a]
MLLCSLMSRPREALRDGGMSQPRCRIHPWRMSDNLAENDNMRRRVLFNVVLATGMRCVRFRSACAVCAPASWRAFQSKIKPRQATIPRSLPEQRISSPPRRERYDSTDRGRCMLPCTYSLDDADEGIARRDRGRGDGGGMPAPDIMIATKSDPDEVYTNTYLTAYMCPCFHRLCGCFILRRLHD